MKRRIVGMALAAAAALAGCNGDATSFTPIDPGSLAFSYEGARTGTYAANGSFTANNGNTVQALPFAAGVKLNDPVAGRIFGIIAYLPVTSTTGHQVTFLLPETAAGKTLSLTETCPTPVFCPGGLLAYDYNLAVPSQEPDTFVFTSGTLTITSLAGGRMTGTFSGVAADSAGIRVVNVTGGTFDVPLVDDERLGQ